MPLAAEAIADLYRGIPVVSTYLNSPSPVQPKDATVLERFANRIESATAHVEAISQVTRDNLVRILGYDPEAKEKDLPTTPTSGTSVTRIDDALCRLQRAHDAMTMLLQRLNSL